MNKYVLLTVEEDHMPHVFLVISLVDLSGVRFYPKIAAQATTFDSFYFPL